VAALSAFTHHLTTTAIMLPVTLNLSRERKIPPSKLLMPLSFAASLGTTITIIGAPAFLIASGVLRQSGRPGLGIFSIAPVGLALTAAGIAFTVLVGRFLLPERKGAEDTGGRFRLENYFTEVKVLAGSPLLGRTVQEVEADASRHLTVVGCMRGSGSIPAGQPLREGDVLLVRTTPEEIIAIREERGVELQPVEQYGADTGAANGSASDGDLEDQLVQAVVAPGADLIGRSLAEIDFRRRYGAVVVSLWRHEGWLGGEMSRIRLRAGDVLVLQGDDDALARVGQDRAFTMLTPFQAETQRRRKAPLAGAIMLATLAGAMLNVMMATIAGATAMVLAGCLTPRQAYRAVDTRIFVFIAGAIPLGTAMKNTGASEQIARWLQRAVGGWHEVLVLLALFAIVGVLTQFMSDSATTAIFAPVAVALAEGLGQPPEAYVVTVAMASVASFLTPIGHHGNLLVYAPGGYRFADFVRVGAPLTAVVGVVVAVTAPLVWH
jgi:di/tricarboxylate transporter